MAFAFGGLPLIYMGDELALRNDPAWAEDPAHADDTRWMHRPPMDWDAAARRADEQHPRGRHVGGAATARRRAPRAPGACTATASHARSRRAIRTSSGCCASTPGERMLLLASFSEQRRPIALSVLGEHGVEAGPRAGEPDGRPLRIDGETLVLEPFQHAWCDG